MTKQEIINRCLNGIGKVRVQGDTTEPIMPFLLGDIMFQSYLQATRKIELRHEMKQYDKRWRAIYKRFNDPIFHDFADDEKVEVTDLMDSLEQHLSNDITRLRAQLMLIFDGVEFEDEQIVTNFLLAHIFAQYANCTWMRVNIRYRRTPAGVVSEEEPCQPLLDMSNLAYKMAIHHLRHSVQGGRLRLDDADTTAIFRVIARKIYDWLKEN